jgi:hypothetical protein
MDDFQHALFQQMESKPFEGGENFTLQNLVEPGEFKVATYNRTTSDMNNDEKSQRLWSMMKRHETPTMISKLGHEPFRYTLFDGCTRKELTEEFLRGECYVKIRNWKDDCDYYFWNTQEAVDAATEYKQYNVLISDELRERLMKCPINMIYLDPQMSDAEAFSSTF